MRFLRNQVFASGHWIPAGTAESDLPLGVKIGNPKAWAEQYPVGQLGPELFTTAAELVIIPPLKDPEEAKAGDTLGIPPQTGHGSAKAIWVAYAESQNVDVSACQNKAEIIGVLDAAGVPTS